MIEKKISYEINIEKPSKTKPVKQGGVFNYLGKQKTVNAPVKWRSSKDHPIAKLAYITKDEEKILIDLNLYGSLKGKPNRGPFGLPSLQGSGSGSGGDGGSSGGDSGGPGDSGPGGSDDGSGHGGPGQGDSGPGGSDDGTGHGGPGPGSGPGGAESGFGIGPDAATEAAQSAAQSISADNVSTQAQADQEDAATAAAAAAAESGLSKAMTTVQNAIRNAINNPVQTAIGIARGPVAAAAFGFARDAISAANRGVTAPDDFSQLDTSVQKGPAESPSGGGIVDLYAPLYNSNTGNPTMDAYIRQLRVNLGLPV
jgi:hypothetical protein